MSLNSLVNAAKMSAGMDITTDIPVKGSNIKGILNKIFLTYARTAERFVDNNDKVEDELISEIIKEGELFKVIGDSDVSINDVFSMRNALRWTAATVAGRKPKIKLALIGPDGYFKLKPSDIPVANKSKYWNSFILEDDSEVSVDFEKKDGSWDTVYIYSTDDKPVEVLLKEG